MSWSRPSRIRSASFVAVLGRFLVALCLWNSPLPLLHAHAGEAQDQATQLAEHLRDCHWRESGQDCSCWHIHLVLWGQVQADHRDSESPPPQQRPVEDLAVPSGKSISRDLAESEQLLSDLMSCDSHTFCDLSDPVAGVSLPRSVFQVRVPVARMTVIRC